MSLTVKAFLAKDGEWDAEIRRFQVPSDVSSSFDYLNKKLCEIFPSLRSGSYASFWKDPDGDVVAFSTDEELVEALGYVTDGVLKVYITTHGGDGGQQDEEQDVHPGVTCNGCEGSICGPRYKCLVCPDYDLCKTCEGHGMHLQHDMMKIATPGGLPGFPGFPFGPFGAAYGGPGGPHNGPGGPHGGPGGPHGPHGPFVPPPHFRRWMQKFMKRWHKHHISGLKSGDEAGKKGEEAGNMEESGDQGTSSGEEYIQNVEENTADMLHSCKIDDGEKSPETDNLAVEAGSENRGRKCHGRRGRGGRGGHLGRLCCKHRGRHGRHGFHHFTPWGPWGMWDWMVDNEMPGAAPWHKRKCEWKRKNKGDTEKEKLRRSKHSHKNNAMETEDPQQGQPSGVMDGNQKSAGVISLKPSGPPLVPSAPNAETVHQSTDGLYTESLHQLIAMGYNNESGWLTRLLEAKRGDIVQVLDVIKPQRQSE